MDQRFLSVCMIIAAGALILIAAAAMISLSPFDRDGDDWGSLAEELDEKGGLIYYEAYDPVSPGYVYVSAGDRVTDTGSGIRVTGSGGMTYVPYEQIKAIRIS